MASDLSRRAIIQMTPLAAGAAGWVVAEVPTAAAETPAAPAVHRAPERRFATVVDVRDFVAAGDTPASDGVQAAIDAAIAAGVPLQFPDRKSVV